MFCVMAAQGGERANAKSPTALASKSATPDLDFLEYLGTLEGDEENWTDVANMELSDAKKKALDGAVVKGEAKSESTAKSGSVK